MKREFYQLLARAAMRAGVGIFTRLRRISANIRTLTLPAGLVAIAPETQIHEVHQTQANAAADYDRR